MAIIQRQKIKLSHIIMFHCQSNFRVQDIKCKPGFGTPNYMQILMLMLCNTRHFNSLLLIIDLNSGKLLQYVPLHVIEINEYKKSTCSFIIFF